MSFEPKHYGVTIEVSKEDLLKTTYNGPSPALKELLDATSIKYTAEWFKSEYEWALEKEPMSYHEPELKAFEEIKVILAGNPDRLNDGEFIYSIIKSVFMKTYSDIIPDEKMLKAAFDAVQIHIIPKLKKEHYKLSFNSDKLKDLQMTCSAMAKHYGATATLEPKANQMAFRLTVTWNGLSIYNNIPQTALVKPNSEIYNLFEGIIEGSVKKLKDIPDAWPAASAPPSNTPLGLTGTNKAGGDLTASSSSGWLEWPSSVTTTTSAESTYWAGATTPIAPSPKPKAPEKPFSIDEMYAAPKPSWAKKDKTQAKGHKHQSGQQTALDKAFEELAAAKTQVLQDIAKLEAEGKPITQTLQAAPQPKSSMLQNIQAKMDEKMLNLFGLSKEKK